MRAPFTQLSGRSAINQGAVAEYAKINAMARLNQHFHERREFPQSKGSSR